MNGDKRDAVEAYVSAIVDIARGEDALDEVEDELLRLARAVEDDPELNDVLTDQQYRIGRRLEALEDVLGSAHRATVSAVTLLVSSGRARQLERIAELVAERIAQERQRSLAEVRVAAPLDDERRERLREALERATGKELDMKVFVDPSLVGGVRAKVGDTIIDGSVARRLEQIRTRLT